MIQWTVGLLGGAPTKDNDLKCKTNNRESEKNPLGNKDRAKTGARISNGNR